ncbi:MAG: enoyl-CoA hydratase-related protein [Myxococcota bacterium]|nr:enoyl-CoA hydratase-related protein [Myxococcota bacterium]
MSDPRELLSEQRGDVGVITFNRPERRNALTPTMLLELHDLLGGWAKEGDVRAVVFTGAGGKSFSSGFDIGAIPTDPDPETARRLRAENPLELGLTSVKRFPYPTIAMLGGHCFGAALNLAVCCDLRVGADDVVVGMPPARLGVVYPADGIAQFAHVLGMARARELFFTGRTYRGAEVQELGLVGRLVPRAELEATTFALAEEIAANAPLALRGIKRVLDLVESASPLSENALAEAQELTSAALRSDDVKEGQKAFLEKRKPRFSGR